MTHLLRLSQRAAVALLAVSLGACADDAAEDDKNNGACVDDEAQFADEVWPNVIQPVCLGCHVADGAAAASDLVFVSESQVGFLDTNRAALASVAALERDGTSLILLKPTGEIEHGGGTIITNSSDEARALEEFVRRLDNPTPTCATDDEGPQETRLALSTPAETLRRASLLLLGDLPSAEQFASVQAGGEPALARALDDIMEDPRFIDRSVEWFNDMLLTDKYIGGSEAIDFSDEERFPDMFWYQTASGDQNLLQRRINDAISREPLMLAAHLVRNNRPMTELLTADFTMVNGYSARSYGLAINTPDPNEPSYESFYEARFEGIPHAGVLTMPVFLNRYPTTATNRNRHRTWAVYRLFLATDILTLAERPVDSASSSVHNPTMNDEQCTLCHSVMDPAAGAFQNWDEDGRYAPPTDGWYTDMRPPGMGQEMIPGADNPRSLQWLAQRIVSDHRFSLAMTRNAYQMVMGRAPLTPASNDGSAEAEARRDAWTAQQAEFERIATLFESERYNFKVLIREMILSSAFRAVGAQDDASSAEVLEAGRFRLLTPEELSRSIEALTGYPWADGPNEAGRLIDDYNLLYGGIDSDAITERLQDPNGVMIAITERLANEVACQHIPRDLSLDADDRLLLPYVDATIVPKTEQGFDIPEAQAQIRSNIQYLLLRVWGEEHAIGSTEVEAAYELFVQTWEEGYALVQAGELDVSLPWQCQSRENFWNGEDLPEGRRVQDDDLYTIRAWMALASYMHRDFRFLYQ